MRVIARRTLVTFWLQHVDAEQSLKAWFSEVSKVKWRTPTDIKARYPSASILIDNRVVFNIKGNRHRLVVKVNYDIGIVFIRFIGTHAEYDKIDSGSN
jgi:mRNA interferase HigB